MSQKIIFIVGPTGVGKSALSLAMAQQCHGEIVSCDAMQVYREVNIACDKPTLEARAVIPHHMIDVASVVDEYDVAQFAKAANKAILEILSRNKTPLVVGGSGMYVTVLLDGIFDAQYRDEDLRKKLFEKESSHLHAELLTKDPVAASKIHPNDAMRLVRALEVIYLSGRPISELQQKREGLWGNYDITIVGLDRKRSLLYARAEERIEEMFNKGLVEEIRAVSQLPISRTAATLIGIPEVRGYIEGAHDLERAKYLMKLYTRRYIKRQLTWFRRDKRIVWFDVDQYSSQEIIKRVL